MYAFEPDDACHAHLLTNMRLNNLVNVEPRRMALQDSPATESISFYRRRLTMASGLVNDGLSSIQPIDDGSGTVSRVVASTVDKEAASEVLQRLDAIKIDVEGAEHRVLLGARNTVLRFGPVIEYEYSTKHDAMTETTNSRDTFNLLQELGYTQYLIRHDDRLILWHKPDAALPIGNLICVPFCASDALRNTIQKLLA